MTVLSRSYPMRLTRNKWNILLLSYHICNENCSILVLPDNEGRITLTENLNYRNGRCPEYGLLIPTPIPIHNYNPDLCSLYNKDEKVIPDNTFRVYIYYPLLHVMEAIIQSPSSDGFTLSELLKSIRSLYEFIYEEEERTSEEQTFKLKKKCNICGNKSLFESLIIENKLENKTDNCSICFDNFETESDVAKLKCNHEFHPDCIKIWLQKSGTCPMCRSGVYECTDCDGKGVIFYNYTGVVIPLEDRVENGLARNPTNGVFGIHTYDLNELVIERFFYDRLNKRLFVDVSNI